MSFALAYDVPGQTTELEELIQGCARNERGAQEKMYTLYYGKMMGVVRRYIDLPEQAEEVLNNGFLRAFDKMDQYNFQGSFEGWLRKICFHAVSDYVKKHARYNDHIVLIEKENYIDQDHAQGMYYNQLIDLIHELPISTRAVFNMFVLEGLSHRDIGKKLGISEGTSKWHLSEGRRQLKEKIERLELHFKH